jgi:hypothetical protein
MKPGDEPEQDRSDHALPLPAGAIREPSRRARHEPKLVCDDRHPPVRRSIVAFSTAWKMLICFIDSSLGSSCCC